MIMADDLCKVVVGEAGSGKTTLIERYITGEFKGENFRRSTLSVGVSFKQLEWAQLEIHDTSGTERMFNAIPKNYCRNANGVILLFDVTNVDSFASVKKWKERVVRLYDADSKQWQPIFILVGNKTDNEIDRVVTAGEGRDKAKGYGIEYMETSAANGTGVNEVFDTLLTQIHGRVRASTMNLRDQQIQPHEHEEPASIPWWNCWKRLRN